MGLGKGFHPFGVPLGRSSEHFLGDTGLAHNGMKEGNNVFRSVQHGEISVNHDSVKTVVRVTKHVPKNAQQSVHRPSPLWFLWSTNIIGNWPVDAKSFLNVRIKKVL
jgi:hypothetical protein